MSRDGSEAWAVVPSDVEIDGAATVECVRLDGRARMFAELPAFNLEPAGDLPDDIELVECINGDWTDLSRDDDPSDDPTLPRAGRHYLVAERRQIGPDAYVRISGRRDWLGADAFVPA